MRMAPLSLLLQELSGGKRRLCVSALAADFTGTWTGTMKLKRPDGAVAEDGTAYLQLKQAGDSVTGKAGRTSDETIEVQNGKVAGETLTFQVRENPDAALMNVRLTLQGQDLVGQIQVDVDGQKMVAELKLKRQ
jgi:hypothetical protein